jgi:hypothetical protein
MFAYANLKYSGLQIAQYLSSGGTETVSNCLNSSRRMFAARVSKCGGGRGERSWELLVTYIDPGRNYICKFILRLTCGSLGLPRSRFHRAARQIMSCEQHIVWAGGWVRAKSWAGCIFHFPGSCRRRNQLMDCSARRVCARRVSLSFSRPSLLTQICAGKTFQWHTIKASTLRETGGESDTVCQITAKLLYYSEIL